ncbi:MAG: hypothetical protein SH847_00805 [Roseiflexaceae bacterium]|nr:hypothetical protein [Roseiflexaceae bacterium]
MSQLRRVWCTNCGTDWTVESQADTQTTETVCPVCYLPMSTSAVPLMSALSVSDLEEQLSQLMASARASGLNSDAIVHALRGELQFAAEMDHVGHHFNVQLIDLGPDESEIHHRPMRDRREILQSRSVNE